MITANRFPAPARLLGLSLGLLMLAGCDAGVDMGSFNLGRKDTAQTAPRPAPDGRGVITYPNYQVVVAGSGDTVASVAARVGLPAEELAKYNGLPVDYETRAGELLSLPRQVAPTPGTLDIASIANSAIDKADGAASVETAQPQTGTEPIRHRVERGETAYSIARLYDVSVTALASWNGLGPDLAVRENQQLLIPVVETPAERVADNSKPGAGSFTPTPPSASKPLPDTVKTEPLPSSPNLGQFKSPDEGRKFLMPVQGNVIAKFSGKAGGNEGIDIAATPGTAVKAAEDGEVALVSKSTGAKTIVLLRHADNIYTVYSNVTDVKLTKGDKVQRGQKLGSVADGSPSYLHFEVRKGTQSVDPAPYL